MVTTAYFMARKEPLFLSSQSPSAASRKTEHCRESVSPCWRLKFHLLGTGKVAGQVTEPSCLQPGLSELVHHLALPQGSLLYPSSISIWMRSQMQKKQRFCPPPQSSQPFPVLLVSVHFQALSLLAPLKASPKKPHASAPSLWAVAEHPYSSGKA